MQACNLKEPLDYRCEFFQRCNQRPRSGKVSDYCGRTFAALDVLVPEALDFVLSLFLIEADLGRSHDLTGTFPGGVKLHLKIPEWIIGAASVVMNSIKGIVRAVTIVMIVSGHPGVYARQLSDCRWNLLH